ncbi:MAG TPA: thiamine phosphate synthase [Crenotrichaceae bacterium]|nr:thiamine phosphate synthase [Crenotrichaceae bacterium]
MTDKIPSRGLYIITDHTQPDEQIVDTTLAALQAGASIVQLRLKGERALSSDAELLAQKLLICCQQHQALFIVNDNPELAQRIGADGVHLGEDDGNILDARNRLGNMAVIGVSCYNSIERALQAQREGADYVAFGRFFPSTSKPDAQSADSDMLADAQSCINVPIVAIGGITPDNGAQLLTAGADYLAVIEGVYGQDNPYQAARNYLNLFK